jgi:hypothetical protein
MHEPGLHIHSCRSAEAAQLVVLDERREKHEARCEPVVCMFPPQCVRLIYLDFWEGYGQSKNLFSMPIF